MNAIKYPRVRTVRDGNTLELEVTYKEGDKPLRFCGESWCHGTCGLPALVIPANDQRREQKAYSDMTAHGALMQSWRLTWEGSKMEVPPEYCEEFLKKWWL